MLMRYILIFLFAATNAGAFEKYELFCGLRLLEASRDTLLAQVGTMELTGMNDGEVTKYQFAAGIPRGSAYCAAGQYFCFVKAAEAFNLSETEIPIPKTGAANAVFNYAKSRGRKSAYLAKEHDLIVWRFSNSWRGHIERVISVGRAGWVSSVGFNTKGTAGEGVHIKRRNIFHPLGRMEIRGIVGFYSE